MTITYGQSYRPRVLRLIDTGSIHENYNIISIPRWFPFATIVCTRTLRYSLTARTLDV